MDLFIGTINGFEVMRRASGEFHCYGVGPLAERGFMFYIDKTDINNLIAKAICHDSDEDLFGVDFSMVPPMHDRALNVLQLADLLAYKFREKRALLSCLAV